MLFDELYDITCKKRMVQKSPGSDGFDILVNRSFQGEDVVSDSKKKFAGTFTGPGNTAVESKSLPELQGNNGILQADCSSSRETPNVYVARGHSPGLEQSDSIEDDSAAATCNDEGPTEDVIREAAANIASMGDQLDENYKKKLDDTSERLANSLNKKIGSTVTYDDFAAILSEVLPMDQDVNTFFFFSHLFSVILWKLGLSFVPYFKRYMSEKFCEEGASVIEKQQHQGPASP